MQTGFEATSHRRTKSLVVSVWMVFGAMVLPEIAAGSEYQIEGLAPGQAMPLAERMALCPDARELRSRLVGSEILKLRVQCRRGKELFTVHTNGDDKIYSITQRNDIEEGISEALIEQLRAAQVERYGAPDLETHKLPDFPTGEVWQYGWGENCVIDPDFGRITAGRGEGACLIIDTDLTASKELLIEHLELTDPGLDPGSRKSSEVELEVYSVEKGARILDFSSN